MPRTPCRPKSCGPKPEAVENGYAPRGMAQFVHLTPEKAVAAVRRSGIKAQRYDRAEIEGFERVVHAMPVVEDFYVSHQWLRELKRSGQRTIVGIYFRIPDAERVLVGHYGQNKRSVTAAEAVGIVRDAENAEGFEVVIPRRIEAKEIQRVAALPQVTGWRYYPGAKGRKPCGCAFCVRGDIKARRLRDAYEAEFGEEG